MASRGPCPAARLVGRTLAHGVWPGKVRRGNTGPPFPWACQLGGSRRQGPWRSDTWLPKQALGTRNVTSLMGKESELAREVEKLLVDIVGSTSTHSKDSWTSLLGRHWTLFHSGVASSERRQARMTILVVLVIEHWSLSQWTNGYSPSSFQFLWPKQQWSVSTSP